jgi:hypothetical protein
MVVYNKDSQLIYRLQNWKMLFVTGDCFGVILSSYVTEMCYLQRFRFTACI